MFYWKMQERALDYLSSCIDQVTSFGDILQLVIVELIYKVGTCVMKFIWWYSGTIVHTRKDGMKYPIASVKFSVQGRK